MFWKQVIESEAKPATAGARPCVRIASSRPPHLIDLSPFPHPGMSRVCSSFEPIGLGGATGGGAPPIKRSVPSRCIAEAQRLGADHRRQVGDVPCAL